MKKNRLETKRNPAASLAIKKPMGGVVRIVGGSYKRTPLKVRDFDGLRPTPERVRETVFNWIAHLLGGCEERSFCDMFAGSGALGLEAASRGARRVLSIEKNRECAKTIEESVEKLQASDRVEVVCADSVRYLQNSTETFDVIFIDPPFASELQLLAVSVAKKRMEPTGLIYVESNRDFSAEEVQRLNLSVLRHGRAGHVYFFVLASPFSVE